MRGGLVWRPWAGALASGHAGFAMLLFFMQVSLVLWPVAVNRAKRFERCRKMQLCLDRLAASYALPGGGREAAGR